MEKCEFMLKLNSFLSQTKESMGIQESSKLNGEGIFSDQIFRKIIKAVIQFIQDVEVDVPFLQEELTHSAHRAISRSQAFEDFAKCFERVIIFLTLFL